MAHLPIFLAGDQANFRVDFKAIHAVDHPAARLFQLLRPFYVVLLVKAGAQFHEDRYLFAVFRRCDQVFCQLALPGNAIQGDLDGDHSRIRSAFTYELQKGLHAFVGITEQNMLLPLQLDSHCFGASKTRAVFGGAGRHGECLPLHVGQRRIQPAVKAQV